MYLDVRPLLKEMGLSDLPDGKKIVREGKEMAKSVHIGKTLFMEKFGVKSEREHKENMKKARKPMFHFHYGLSNFDMSAKGLELIYSEAEKHGHRIDRFGCCLDRVMGLPEELRKNAPAATGLKLKSKEEWAQIGRIVPIQPHMGDHIVGSPASVENLINALNAGATTIGNMGQFMTFEYPGWTDQVTRITNTLKALGIMAGLRDKGVMLHSSIDDGFGSVFYDQCSFVGWAMVEKYLYDETIGVKLANCFGNVCQKPRLRMCYALALDKIHNHDCTGSMIVGNTLGATPDFDRNYGVTFGYAVNDYVMQLYSPTGHAINPLPVTELTRIPSPMENAVIQTFTSEVAKLAEKQYEITNFELIENQTAFLMEKGKVFYDRLLDTFSDYMDIEDPFKVLYACRKLGGVALEQAFSDDSRTKDTGERVPYYQTGVYEIVHNMIDAESEKVTITDDMRERLRGKKIVIGCTDVHEYGKTVVGAILRSAGAEVLDFGCSVDADVLVKKAKENNVDFVCLSTYNGMALSYANQMIKYIEEENLEATVFMGGRLNDDGGHELPVDVTEDLHKYGIRTSETVPELLSMIDELLQKDI